MSCAARTACLTAFLGVAAIYHADAQTTRHTTKAAPPSASAVTPPVAAATDQPADAKPAPERTTPIGPGLSDYTGTLDGNKPVHFTVILHPDGSITGSYFLLSSMKTVPFTGKAIDANSFSARVAKSADAPPYLYLKVDKSRPVGEWLSGSVYGDGGAGQQAVAVSLQSANPGIMTEADRYDVAGAKDAALIETNAQSFWQAVTSNQPDKAAALVSYPLAYTESGRRTLVHTPADFEKKFPVIFTPAYVAQLKSITPKAMFANWQGIMLGSGQVWFNADGKAFALNNEPVKMYAGKHFLSNAGWTRASHTTTAKNTASGGTH
jgi:hypothetical protein